MHQQGVTVKVPASTANMGPGFDSIGMAFQLYTVIRMELASKTTIRAHGDHLALLATDKSNLIYQVAAHLYQSANLPIPELLIEVNSEIPLTRGLGSSAAAVVGALVAANILAGKPYTTDELFSMAARWEGHPDNVGASFFGGVIVSSMPEDKTALVPYVRFPIPDSLRILAVIPDYWLSTDKARSALPETYSKQDAVFTIGHSSLLVAALAQNRLDLLAHAMQDKIHQPYRASLIPGLTEILENAVSHGALGVALSGAGPTSICFYETDEQRDSLSAFLTNVMADNQIAFQLLDLVPDTIGIQIA
ncbi:homoserine kinase [Shimazuella alba]|uniref:Homoserine kinase n=1 Tax=Shimazuella alba TaxID=2690964 RepID=A0A6I4VV71_9BACL|nr:homoserine kinase [Shimazuella alba]MXQ55769.1 homoserine kinase [Shimazuella alba]